MAIVADGQEPITIQRRGSSDQTVVPHALRRTMTEREAAASNGHYTATDALWYLPKGECPLPPRLGDAIVDAADARWTVLEVDDAAPGTCWICVGRNLALAYGLDDTIDVEQALYGKGEGGAVSITWQTWRTGVRARIQPGPLTLETVVDICRSVQKFQVFVAEDLAIDRHYRLRAADGLIYRVIGSQAAQQIGKLPVIEVEVIR